MGDRSFVNLKKDDAGTELRVLCTINFKPI